MNNIKLIKKRNNFLFLIQAHDIFLSQFKFYNNFRLFYFFIRIYFFI